MNPLHPSEQEPTDWKAIEKQHVLVKMGDDLISGKVHYVSEGKDGNTYICLTYLSNGEFEIIWSLANRMILINVLPNWKRPTT